MAIDFPAVCRDVITRHAEFICEDGIEDFYEQVNQLALDLIKNQAPENCKKSVEIFQYRLQEISEAKLNCPIPSKVTQYILDILKGQKGFMDVKIGEGRFNVVYEFLRSDKVYAIKCPKEKSNIIDINEEFHFLSHLVHENIVLAFENLIFEEPTAGHEVGIVLELAECSLKQVLKGGELEQRPLYGYMRDIIRGTDFLHESGYVHGDLKTENVCIFSDGRAKLVDFGYCHEIGSVGPLASKKYRAFEVSHESPMLPETEVFSVGVLIYNIFSAENGAYQFPEFHECQLIAGKVEMLSPKHPMLKKKAKAIKYLIQGLLECNPDDRFALAESLEILETLN